MKGEGSASAVRSRGAPRAKSHGQRPRSTHGSNGCSLILKRSYKRALRRVQKFGSTWYRGKLLTGTTSTSPTTPIDHCPTSVTGRRRGLNRRLRILNWNAGGLSKASWDALAHWLNDQIYDVILISRNSLELCE